MKKSATMLAIEAHLGAPSWLRTALYFVGPWSALLALTVLYAEMWPRCDVWMRGAIIIILGVWAHSAVKSCQILSNDLALRRQQKQLLRDISALPPEYQEELLVNLNQQKEGANVHSGRQ